jgi:tetratricopeptide (TPR) repeat protein
VPEPLEAPAETIRLRIAEGVMGMIESITEGAPAVIVIDDTPFMDPASRDVVTVLTRRARALPVLVVHVTRPTSTYGSLTERSASTVQHVADAIPGSTVLELEPLDQNGVFDLVSALDPTLVVEHPAVAKRLGDLSEGNPQFVELLLLDWHQHRMGSIAGGEAIGQFPHRWTPPESLRLAFVRQYDDLAASSRQLLDLISVARRGLEPDVVSKTLGLSQPETDAAILSLLSRGIIRFSSGALCIKNEVHRAYVYHAIPAEVRRFYHVKLGGHLEGCAQVSGDTGAYLEAAAHFLMADETGAALRLVLENAPRAVESGGHAEAEQVVRAIVGKTGDALAAAQLHLLLARAMTVQGRYADALGEIDRAEAQASPGFVLGMASALRAQALQRTRLGGEHVILAQCRRALEAATNANDEEALALAVQVALEAGSEMSNDDLLNATRLHLQSLAQEAKTPAARGRSLSAEGFCSMEVGDFGKALGAFRSASAALREGRLDADLARSLNGQGICNMAVGAHPEALKAFKDSLTIARRLRDSEHMATVFGNLGLAYEERGSWNESWDAYLSAVDLAQASGSPRRIALALANLGHLAIVKGDFDLARARLMEARQAADDSGLGGMQSLIYLTEADLHLATEEPELAWMRVSDADFVRGGRGRAIDNNGKYLRLRLHRLLATEGEAALEGALAVLPHDLESCRTSDRLEVEAFIAWYRLRSSGDAGPARSALASAVHLGLPGVLGILVAVKTSPTDCDPSARGLSPSSTIQYLIREFGYEPPGAATLPAV